jgi:hypothetical protein
VGFAHREVRGMRSAESHGDAESLGRAEDDVGAEFAGRREHGQGQWVGGHRDERVGSPAPLDDRREVGNRSGAARILNEYGVDAIEIGGERIRHQGVEADRFRPGLDDRNRLWVAIGIDDEAVALFASTDAMQHRHRFAGCGAFVEQGSVGHVHSAELGDHRLEVQEGLESALGDLRLIGRVGGVPAGVLHDVATDDGWGDGAVVAHADQRRERAVRRRDALQFVLGGLLADRIRQVERGIHADVVGHGLVDEFGHAADPEGGEHLLAVGAVRADVASDEGVAALEFGKGGTVTLVRGVGHGFLRGRERGFPARSGGLRASRRSVARPSLSPSAGARPGGRHHSPETSTHRRSGVPERFPGRLLLRRMERSEERAIALPPLQTTCPGR